jgi:WD40 repeat protein
MMDLNEIPISLKWSKQVFSLTIQIGDSGRSMKEQVQELTHVPIERQKLLCSKKKGSIHWKGSLSNDFIFTVADDASSISPPLVVTLIGSAEAIQAPKVRTQFVEDMTDEERRAVDEATEQDAAQHAVGMIAALQLPPHHRDDGKQETYQYNRLVSGLPQRQIEDLVRQENFVGEVAMTMGSELRRAYVNDLAVIQSDGTLISALDDGHVQLWRHGQIQYDVIHDGGDGGVDSVVSIDSSSNKIAFCTSGRGCFRLWSHDAQNLVSIPTPVPGISPVSLVQVPILQNNNSNLICLAARFQITQHPPPNQFHLVPQDEEGRRRRVMAEAQEAARQEVMNKMSRSIQVIYGSADGTSQLRSHLLTVEGENAAPITCLTAFATQDNTSGFLVSGDAIGGIGFWKPQVMQENGRDVVKCTQLSYTQLVPDNEGGSSIVCMEPIGDGRHLAVSTRMTTGRTTTSATRLSVPLSQAVYVLDVGSSDGSSDGNFHISRILTGHTKDAVHCMQALPNGDLLTGGGKFDATLQLWSSAQLFTNDGVDERNEPLQSSQASQQLSSVGYVFAMATLPDKQNGSSRFAIAAARYNTVKIIL